MSRSPSPTRDEGPDTYPSFSEYAHVANTGAIGQLTFAVGLRAEDPDEIIRRMLPLSVIKERPVAEKRKTPKKPTEIKICERPECVSRRDKLGDLNSENNELRTRLKEIESKLASSQNKIALTEKTIGISEDKIDNLKGQIEDTETRIFTAEEEVTKLDEQNQSLRDILGGLQKQVDEIKSRTDDTVKDTNEVIKAQTSGERVVFGKRKPGSSQDPLATDVLNLGRGANNNNNATEDSDDD